MIKEAIAKVVKGEDLDDVMMTKVMDEIMEGEATDTQKASFLTAMSMKGETIEEITSAAKVMRSHCEKFLNNMDVLEIVGTGGDGSNTFNISTRKPCRIQQVRNRRLSGGTGCKDRPCTGSQRTDSE